MLEDLITKYATFGTVSDIINRSTGGLGKYFPPLHCFRMIECNVGEFHSQAMMYQMCSALLYLHDREIMHRDVRPSVSIVHAIFLIVF